MQVATFGTEASRSAVLSAARGYRSNEYPDGLSVDVAQYIAGLIPSERGFIWPISDMINGNEEKDRKPNNTFIEEINKYPGLLDIVTSIEGLVNKRSQHASGVIIYNHSPLDTGAFMRSPNGDLITQFELHDLETLGDTKFDFLLTEVSDKLIVTIDLLKKNGYFDSTMTLRQIYNKYLHPSVLDLDDQRIWDALASGNILDIFQFNTDVGLAAAKSIKPKSPIEMMMANALIRLTGEKGKERPIDRYIRMKNDIGQWYNECRREGLTEKEIHILEPYYLPVGGTPTTQEKLMMLCLDKDIAHFSLKESNSARKTCSKKRLSEIPALHEKFIGQCPRELFGEYVWKTAIEPQMSYAFAEPHALVYSFIGIQILYLAVNYPIIYWNCACLIVNSGSIDYDEDEDWDNENDDIESDDSTEAESDYDSTKKETKRKIDYGKIASAIGKFKSLGLNVAPPNINTSGMAPTPDEKKNVIYYGLRGITKVPMKVVEQILVTRPYSSLKDCLSKTNITKVPMIYLIKAGAFDEIEGRPREQILHDYLFYTLDTLKKTLNLRNFDMLVRQGLIPDEYKEYIALVSLNKELKKHSEGLFYKLFSHKVIDYFCSHFNQDLIVNAEYVKIKDWDKLYKKKMDIMRQYIKDNLESLLKQTNDKIIEEEMNKYAAGTISKWEMDSLSFYSHEHELSHIQEDLYDIVDFYSLDEEPVPQYSFQTKDGKDIVMYQLFRIAGTVLEKNKLKNSITLLTTTGVVTVKIWKNQYSLYDRQIKGRIDDSDKMKILERSWFSRGQKLLLTGIRRGDYFIPKVYRNSVYKYPVEKINEVTEKGTLICQRERITE